MDEEQTRKLKAEEPVIFNDHRMGSFTKLSTMDRLFLEEAVQAMRTVIDARTIDDHFPGIGRYTFQLARALVREKDRGELVLLSNLTPSNARFNLADLGSEPDIRIVPTSARPFTAQEQLRLPCELRGLKPGVIHFPYAVMPYATPRPVVVTIHDIIPLCLPRFFSFRQRLQYRVSLSMALRTAAAIICVSAATRADLTSAFHIDASRIVVIPEGVEEHFRPSKRAETERIRSAYSLPERYILYLGSNKPHKNLQTLIRAWACVHSDILLVIAGSEDPRFDAARRETEQLGLADHIRFLGAVKEEELPALYSGAHAFVFPSLCEGFGLPPLEAMACGVPVACADIPSLRETAGNAALFFNPVDCESLASALQNMTADEALRENLRVRGLQRAAELTWDRAAKKTLDVYRTIARRG